MVYKICTVFLLIGLLFSTIAYGGTLSECKRAYAYTLSGGASCFKYDGFHECGFTNKFYETEFHSGSIELPLYIPGDYDDQCCDVHSSIQVGNVLFYVSEHELFYSLEFSTNSDSYGFQEFNIFIGENDNKYPRDSHNNFVLDFDQFLINEQLDSLIHSAAFNEKYDRYGSVNLIASAVVCPKQECDMYDPYYIPKCKNDPCDCHENYLCKDGECKENGCNQCKEGAFQKGREYPCLDCKEFFGEGCKLCNDAFGCAQCEAGYYQVPKEDAKCGLSYCVKIPGWQTPAPTKWVVIDPPTSWTPSPTSWKHTDPPTSWKATDPPTLWSRDPTSWTAPPTPWTPSPTAWTPATTDPCHKYTPYYVPPCSEDPCPCYENKLCKDDECKENGCNQCEYGAFQKGREFPCLDCKEFFGEGCRFCNDGFGCAQCEDGYYQVNKDEAKCGLSYCVKIPTPKPTDKPTPYPTWQTQPPTRKPTDKPTSSTEKPTSWTDKPTTWKPEPSDPPTSWTAPPTPWTPEPTWETKSPTSWKRTDPPTSWTPSPTSWTSPPTPWTVHPTSWTPSPTSWKRTDPPTSWTPSPIDTCQPYDPFYIPPCKKDPCECHENPYCEINECKENGCNKCKEDYFQKGRQYPCMKCDQLFGEGCKFCNDGVGCGQCHEGYTLIPKEDAKCHLSYCVKNPTPSPTKKPTPYPTWETKPPTKKLTNKPTSWTDKPTSWTPSPTSWKSTDPPTSWTPSPTWDTKPPTKKPIFDCPYIKQCSANPCPCVENPKCEMDQCKINGCNKCKQDSFQLGSNYPCKDCKDAFGEGCNFCNDYIGCAQCGLGYHHVSIQDSECGVSYCKKCEDMYEYSDCVQET